MNGTPWDFPSVSTTSHGTLGCPQYSGMGWTPENGGIVHGTLLGFPQCVQYFLLYSGMGWTPGIGGIVHGTAWDSHSVSITSHGTVGWDGMDIVGIPSVCPF